MSYLYRFFSIKKMYNLILNTEYNNENEILNLKQELINNGSLFIKLGQYISQNPNKIKIFTKNEIDTNLITKILSPLQNNTPIYDKNHIKNKLEYHNIENIIIDEPIGSGSIAQVYKTKDEKKAIKILHPKVVEDLETDISIIKSIKWCLNWFNKTIDILDIDQFMENLKNQCNLLNESHYTDVFSKNFEKYPKERIFFPKIFFKKKDLIIEEYIDGLHLNDFKLKYPHLNIICKIKTMAALIQMILIDGIMHSDCHNGNILYKLNEKKMEIYFIDCGIVSVFSEDIKNGIIKFISGISNKDTDLLIEGVQKVMKNKALLNKEEIDQIGNIMAKPGFGSEKIKLLTDYFINNNLKLEINFLNAMINLVLISQDENYVENYNADLFDIVFMYIVELSTYNELSTLVKNIFMYDVISKKKGIVIAKIIKDIKNGDGELLKSIKK